MTTLSRHRPGSGQGVEVSVRTKNPAKTKACTRRRWRRQSAAAARQDEVCLSWNPAPGETKRLCAARIDETSLVWNLSRAVREFFTLFASLCKESFTSNLSSQKSLTESREARASHTPPPPAPCLYKSPPSHYRPLFLTART